ncbi:N(4)-(beta-N-acetylglucosaminyl)-L-asparaginase [Helcococcus kunzii]|uniref:N(4)-(beta-N-acetylglucosaminyl)-L-asparaginase n=1 Tax=Helcococcus kunzii TaxID=40091 RepID=UPI0024AC951B|nr:N(4)-(beta-N-acetylglucosaminyl)-L-asparaginase [Helcococcus kunzii]
MWAVIGTWRMSLEGIENNYKCLKEGEDSGEIVENIIKDVEDFPFFKSVGYGGLPNEDMEVEMDAGFMDGNNFNIGAIAGIRDFSNPISIARKLSDEKVNCFLVGDGAERYAHKAGFERKNMLTDRAIIHYKNRVKKDRIKQEESELKPYIGHDTVGVVCLDTSNKISVGTSTSGLFMKKKGRVGDSPVIGSGFYADSEIGGASATGLGEDLMKGCISYEIVRLMSEGLTPQQACDKAVSDLEKKLIKLRGKAGDLSVVAINNKGEYGVSTNIEGFSFVYASEKHEPKVYLTKREAGKSIHYEASQEWLDDYMKTRTAELKLL